MALFKQTLMPVLIVVGIVITQTTSHPTSPTAAAADDEALSGRQQSATRQFSVAIPELQQTQYQVANDKEGTYSFGYAYPDQMHTESRSSDGQVSGSYFYKDPNGHTNKVQYRADKSGFRVMTNNIPPVGQAVHDTPEVAEARRQHLETWQAIAQFNSRAAEEAAAQQQQQQSDESESDAIAVEANEPEGQIYVAPLDIEPVPAAFRVIEQEEEEQMPEIVEPLPVAESLLTARADDHIIDESKQAVITDDGKGTASSDNYHQTVVLSGHQPTSDIEVDVEPIKLLAQLYAKHLQQNADSAVPLDIQRPAGFHPNNLQSVNDGFDLFSRSEGDERQAVEVTNPEFIDLRAFLLTNRFREALQDHLKSSSNMNQYDLSLSDEMDPMQQGTYIPQDLLNYYYNQQQSSPFYITRETFDKLPLSLKLAALGLNGVDGQHTAQIPASKPYNNNFKNNNNNNNFYSMMPSYYTTPYYQRNLYNQYYNPYYGYMLRSSPYYSYPYYPTYYATY